MQAHGLHMPTTDSAKGIVTVPLKTIYAAVLPYLTNKDNRLGEDTPVARARNLQRIQFVTTWLDAKYKIPFTKYKIGLDPVISSVPWVGDAVSTALSCYIVYLARRFHVPWYVTAKMVWNVMLNASFGAIPIVGSAFDMAYKPNMRNLVLLEEYLRKEALAVGRDTTEIDEALRKSRAEIIPLLPDDGPPLPARPEVDVPVTSPSSSSSAYAPASAATRRR